MITSQKYVAKKYYCNLQFTLSWPILKCVSFDPTVRIDVNLTHFCTCPSL